MKQILKKLITITDLDIKNYLAKQIVCLVYLTVYTISSVIFPGFVSRIVDDGVIANDIPTIVRQSAAMLACGAIMGISFYMQKINFFKLGNAITYKTKNRVYDKITRLNLNYWNKNKVGNVITTLDSDVSKIEELLTTNISDLIINIFLSFGIGIYILGINVRISLLVILSLLAFTYAQRVIAGKAKIKMNCFRATLGEVNSYTTETINNMTSVQLTGKSSYVKDGFRSKNKKLISDSLAYMKTVSLVSVIGQLFGVIGIFFSVLLGAFEIIQGRMTVGLMFSMTIYVQRLYSPVVNLGNSFVKIKSLAPIIDNIYELICSEDELKSGTLSINDRAKGKIRFREVSFRYDAGHYIVWKFNECFLPGEIIGIVGENGSGKTTIGRLITGLCTPEEGTIEIDDVDINNYDIDYLQSQIGYMTQDNFILTDELNSLLNDKKQRTKAIAYFRELNFAVSGLLRMRDKFSLKENKVNISGGEAQKIALYQLYSEDKPICILDEPTSALDALSEDKMIDFIRNNFSDKTVIIITHKKKILEICHRVICFSKEDGGREDNCNEVKFVGNQKLQYEM